MALGMHYILMAVLRFVQFALAITVCGLYGVDLHNATAAGKYSDSKWVRSRRPLSAHGRKYVGCHGWHE